MVSLLLATEAALAVGIETEPSGNQILQIFVAILQGGT